MNSTKSAEFLERHAKRQIGSVLLAKATSESRPTQDPHQIRLGSDNLVYCSCEAWNYHKAENDLERNCKHIDSFREVLTNEMAALPVTSSD